ncbi:SusD/RagB family nutrient-binding outer membrane lipoprotein [Chitinophagaceae bacterium LWZ2-11]
MKKIALIILSGVVILNTSCKRYLDINQNPNSATSSTPELILPQSIVYTASVSNTYNTYGAQVGGYAANSGGYGGFGNNFSYTFGPSDYSGLWSASYDALNDIQYIIDSTKGKLQYAYYNAVATILKVYNYQLLVDAYNNVPFSNSLKGMANFTPIYDDAKTIYPLLSNLLDSAILKINTAVPPNGTVNSALALSATVDPLFKGTLTSWKQFANTIKLKLIIRASAKITMPSTTFDPAGFLTADAIVNPGYGRTSSASGTQVNPTFNSWVATYSGGKGNRSWVPSKYAFAFYGGTGAKLIDNARGTVVYYNFAAGTTGTAQLGVLNQGTANGNTGNWYDAAFTNPGTSVAAGTGLTTVGNSIGVMKGPDMGQPLMLAAESYFLQAEAILRSIPGVTGTDAAAFNNGITQSFSYLYKLANGAFPSAPPASGPNSGLHDYSSTGVTTDVNAYLAANPTSYLVRYALATTPAQKLEAIITQKYIALNMIHSHEAWNEYRRTGYPISDGSLSATTSFSSTQSTSGRSDKLPTRIQYPQSEFNYNQANVPIVNVLTDLIFWAK